MKRSVRLTLKKETLAPLADDELAFAGATAVSAATCVSCPTCASCVECLIYVEPTTPCVSRRFNTLCCR